MPKKKQKPKAKDISAPGRKKRPAGKAKSVSSSGPGRSEQYTEALKKAEDFLDRGKHEEAVIAAGRLLTPRIREKDPTLFLSAARISAFANVNLRNYIQAAETALQALKIDNDLLDFHYILTVSYYGMEEYGLVEVNARRFLELASDQPQDRNWPVMFSEAGSRSDLIYNFLGTALREQDRYEEACQAYEKSYAVNPEYVTAYINHAQLLHGIGDDAGACMVLDRASGRGLKSEEVKMLRKAYMSAPVTHFSPGQTEYNRGDLQKALNKLQAEVRKHPDNWTAHYFIGKIYVQMEDDSAAEEAFLEACNLCQNDVNPLYSLARLYFDSGRQDESLKYLEKIQAADKDFVQAHRLTGDINFQSGKYREACDAYVNFVMRMPDDPEVWINLGDSHFKLEEFEQAKQCYEKVIEIDSACSLAYRNLAVCETRLNNFENAYRVLTDYLELAGEDYNLIVMAAEIAANLQKFDEAIKYGERALEINPHSPQLLTLLGDCYYSGGFLVSAKMSFEQALKIDPNFDPARQRILQINEIQDARKR